MATKKNDKTINLNDLIDIAKELRSSLIYPEIYPYGGIVHTCKACGGRLYPGQTEMSHRDTCPVIRIEKMIGGGDERRVNINAVVDEILGDQKPTL